MLLRWYATPRRRPRHRPRQCEDIDEAFTSQVLGHQPPEALLASSSWTKFESLGDGYLTSKQPAYRVLARKCLHGIESEVFHERSRDLRVVEHVEHERFDLAAVTRPAIDRVRGLQARRDGLDRGACAGQPPRSGSPGPRAAGPRYSRGCHGRPVLADLGDASSARRTAAFHRSRDYRHRKRGHRRLTSAPHTGRSNAPSTALSLTRRRERMDVRGSKSSTSSETRTVCDPVNR
jgi:hypothetical protein